MTQLSLFDSVFDSVVSPVATTAPVSHAPVSRTPVVRPSISFPPLLPESDHVAEEQAVIVGQPAITERRTSLRDLAQQIHEGRMATRITPEKGVQRMGDLAKIVLERYDMVAARRAKRAGE